MLSHFKRFITYLCVVNFPEFWSCNIKVSPVFSAFTSSPVSVLGTAEASVPSLWYVCFHPIFTWTRSWRVAFNFKVSCILLTVHPGMILVNNQLEHNFSCMFISILYMFRAAMCPSSGELLYQCDTWFMSLCVDDRLLCRLTCIPDSDINQVSHWYNNSPDDGHMAARNMYRIEINIHEKFLRQFGYLQGSISRSDVWPEPSYGRGLRTKRSFLLRKEFLATTKNFCVLHNRVEHNYISSSSTTRTTTTCFGPICGPSSGPKHVVVFLLYY